MALWHVAFCCVVPWIINTMEASRDLCHTTNAHSIGNITISYDDPQTHLSCWIKGNPHSHKELLGKIPATDLAQKKNKPSFLFNVTNPSWTSDLYCSHGQAAGLGAGMAPAEGQWGAGWWEAMEGSWMMLNVFPSGEPKSLRFGRILPSLHSIDSHSVSLWVLIYIASLRSSHFPSGAHCQDLTDRLHCPAKKFIL